MSVSKKALFFIKITFITDIYSFFLDEINSFSLDSSVVKGKSYYILLFDILYSFLTKVASILLENLEGSIE